MPYKISTLLYCFDPADRVLLLRRARSPNLGFWSPCGGKLQTDIGESPYACALREAREEIGQTLELKDLRLTGIVSEHGYAGEAHWLMFLFEVMRHLTLAPPTHEEGEFEFFRREQLDCLNLPTTDRHGLWPLFWKHRGGFFAAHCHCDASGRCDWIVEESRPLVSDSTTV